MNSDLIISILVLCAILAAILVTRADARKYGQQNPVGTGTLQADVASLKNKMGRMETDIQNIRHDLDAAPDKADIARLEERIAGVTGHVESIDNAVVRIENILLTGAHAAVAAAAKPPRRRS